MLFQFYIKNFKKTKVFEGNFQKHWFSQCFWHKSEKALEKQTKNNKTNKNNVSGVLGGGLI